MKKYLLFFVLFGILFVMNTSMVYARKKVAVVLSGGGAKGMAHIGVLKVIEEAGIPVDYVVGTSMGSIIGGLYAMGYTPKQLDSLVRRQDWRSLLSDVTPRKEQSITEREESAKYLYTVYFGENKPTNALQGVINGRNLDKMFKKLTIGYHHVISFDSLSIPFACVATNAVDGTEYVFHKGVLSRAMMASMSIPGVFSPVRMDSLVLVDGGLVNNYPADVARKMGADIIIGVVFQDDKAQLADLASAAKVLRNLLNIETRKKLFENEAISNLVLHVNVGRYSMTSFEPSAVDSLILYGERTARSKWDSLLILKKEINGTGEKRRTPISCNKEDEKFFISDLTFQGIGQVVQKEIRKHCHLWEGHNMSLEAIENVERQITDEMCYNYVTYNLEKVNVGYKLTYIVRDRRKIAIRFGARLDKEEIASLLISGTVHFSTDVSQMLDVTARLGKRSYGLLDYGISLGRRKTIGTSYKFEYNDVNIYTNGDRSSNIVYNLHTVNLHFVDNNIRNFRYSVQAEYAYYNYRDFLSEQVQNLGVKSDHYFNYIADVVYDSYDRAYFPNKGLRFFVKYGCHTDDFVHYNNHEPFQTVTYSIEKVFSLTGDRLKLIPSVYGRDIFGKEYGFSYSNFLGGMQSGHYVEWQLPFPGVGYVERVKRHNLNASMDLRERVSPHTFAWIRSSLGFINEKFYHMFQGKTIFGMAAGYSIDSFVGPLNVSMGYSNYTKSVCFYIDFGMNF